MVEHNNAVKVLDEYMNNAFHFTTNRFVELLEPVFEKANAVLGAYEHYNRTGEINDVLEELVKSKAPSHKENQESIQPTAKKGRRGRSKTVLQDPIQLQIKKEKISEVSSCSSKESVTTSLNTTDASVQLENVVVKTEKEEMPAPTWLPPKKKKVKPDPDAPEKLLRSTRTRDRKAKVRRDSDVEIAENPLPTIDLADSDDSISSNQSTNASKTKTKAQKKVAQDSDTDQEETRSTRTRTQKKNAKLDESTQVNGNSETEVRSTRTRTVRKGKKPNEESESESEHAKPQTAFVTKTTENQNNAQSTEPDNAPVRSTRTKTLRKAKAVDETESDKNEKAVAREIATTKRQKDAIEIENKETNGKKRKEENIKRSRSGSGELDDKDSKDKKFKENVDANVSTKTQYEDAVSTIASSTFVASNSTFVSSQPKASELKPEPAPTLNSTVVLEKLPLSQAVENNPPLNNKELMTDDESDSEAKTPPRKINKIKAPKEVFSPYEKTTLKKKVEAFEKLNANANTSKIGSATKVKPFTTPLSKCHPISSSTMKVDKVLPPHNNSSITSDSTRCLSSQKEYRERQLREKEAAKKREAMLLALKEEKRRKNLEKQLKAQQQRKNMELEKQKQIEIIKKKEEDKKVMLAEREEYLQKQKEEMEKVRQQKRHDAEVKKQKEKESQKPIFLMTDAPLLPTEDCYDSDDSHYHERQKQRVEPKWCRANTLKHQQFIMMAAGEKIKNTLFCRSAQTPDLRELLEVVDERVLKRNSSAYWRKPPRYTLVADLDGTRFSDDEDFVFGHGK